MKQLIEELASYMKEIESFSKDMSQDGSALHEYLITLTNHMARANYVMAEYQKKFRDEKKKAYLRLKASSESQASYYAPSLAKDFVDSQCSDSGYVFDLAERLSRLCVHTIDAVRTIVSSLKNERQFASYQ